ncbi:hypothetical protein AB0O58_22090 [Rhodococcus sp. NPDC080181]|jgi:hypothetical protein|uniref:hypothetical protein n=1 Tax=Rhodococcus sp. NPDC080181 TaxID=3155292 RepID=UPI00344F33B0
MTPTTGKHTSTTAAVRSASVRSAAAKVAVKAAQKQKKTPDPKMVKLAESKVH